MGNISKFQLLISIMLFALLTACSGSAEEETEVSTDSSNENGNSEAITLDAVSFIPTNHPVTATIQDWIDNVQEATDGRVEINWRGGPDVVPVSEQLEAMKSGVTDITFGFIGQYQSQLPEASAIALSKNKPWEERENGFYDFMVDRHENLDIRYIGRYFTGAPRIWFNEPIESIEDLNNKVIRSTANYQRFFDELGISSTMTDQADVYTSLQSGLVEGFVHGTLIGPRQDGWTDTAKYVLDVPFWTDNAVILMNNTSWDSISDADQQAIVEATTEYEKDMVEYFEEVFEEERKELEGLGVEFIKFKNESDETEFLEIAYDVEWSYLAEELPEEITIDELRELTE